MSDIAPDINRPAQKRLAEIIASLDVDPQTRMKIVATFRRELIHMAGPSFNPRLFTKLANVNDK